MHLGTPNHTKSFTNTSSTTSDCKNSDRQLPRHTCARAFTRRASLMESTAGPLQPSRDYLRMPQQRTCSRHQNNSLSGHVSVFVLSPPPPALSAGHMVCATRSVLIKVAGWERIPADLSFDLKHKQTAMLDDEKSVHALSLTRMQMHLFK